MKVQPQRESTDNTDGSSVHLDFGLHFSNLGRPLPPPPAAVQTDQLCGSADRPRSRRSPQGTRAPDKRRATNRPQAAKGTATLIWGETSSTGSGPDAQSPGSRAHSSTTTRGAVVIARRDRLPTPAIWERGLCERCRDSLEHAALRRAHSHFRRAATSQMDVFAERAR